MNKYIVKNCPLYEQYDCFNIGRCKNSNSCNGIYTGFCKDISNCLLKQIVELCNEYKNNYCINNGVHLLIGEILNLLEIENINEEKDS